MTRRMTAAIFDGEVPAANRRRVPSPSYAPWPVADTSYVPSLYASSLLASGLSVHRGSV